MLSLPQVTLIGIDCLNIDRLILAADISTTDISFGAVKLLSSCPSADSRVVNIEPINSIEAYSEFCLTRLHEYVDTPYALVIQHDGFILNPSAWQEVFLNYDYIGAPILIGEWAKEKHDVNDSNIGSLVVGNGGFSLRSHKLMKLTSDLVARGEVMLGDPEDWLMAYTYRERMEEEGICFAPVSVAEVFSFEGRSLKYYQYQNSFGFHSLRYTDLTQWFKANPQYQSKIKNQLDMSVYY